MTHLHPDQSPSFTDKTRNVVIAIMFVFLALGTMTFATIGIVTGLQTVNITAGPLYFASIIIGSQVIGLGGISLFYLWITDEPITFFKFDTDDILEDVLLIGGIALLVFGASMISTIITTVVGIEGAENAVQGSLEQDPRNIYVFIALSILVVGPLEELFFRGVVQEHFTKLFSEYTAIIFGAVIFSAIHIPSIIGDSPASYVPYLSVLFVGGALFGYAYYRTQNLAVPMLAHGFYNAILGVLFLL